MVLNVSFPRCKNLEEEIKRQGEQKSRHIERVFEDENTRYSDLEESCVNLERNREMILYHVRFNFSFNFSFICNLSYLGFS